MKLQTENQEMKMDRTIDMYNAETQRIRALSDNMVDGNELELKAIQTILDNSIKMEEHEIQRAQLDHSHLASAGDLAVKHNKMLHDAQTKLKLASQGAGRSSASSSKTAP